MKTEVIDDLINILCPDSEIPDVKAPKTVTPDQLGGFQVLYDETAVVDLAELDKKAKLKKATGTWR